MYGEYEAFVSIETGEVIEGKLCPGTPPDSSKEWTWRDSRNCGRIGAAPGKASRRRGLQVSMLTKVTHLERLGGFRLRGCGFNDGSEASTISPLW